MSQVMCSLPCLRAVWIVSLDVSDSSTPFFFASSKIWLVSGGASASSFVCRGGGASSCSVVSFCVNRWTAYEAAATKTTMAIRIMVTFGIFFMLPSFGIVPACNDSGFLRVSFHGNANPIIPSYHQMEYRCDLFKKFQICFLDDDFSICNRCLCIQRYLKHQ